MTDPKAWCIQYNWVNNIGSLKIENKLWCKHLFNIAIATLYFFYLIFVSLLIYPLCIIIDISFLILLMIALSRIKNDVALFFLCLLLRVITIHFKIEHLFFQESIDNKKSMGVTILYTSQNRTSCSLPRIEAPPATTPIINI